MLGDYSASFDKLLLPLQPNRDYLFIYIQLQQRLNCKRYFKKYFCTSIKTAKMEVY